MHWRNTKNYHRKVFLPQIPEQLIPYGNDNGLEPQSSYGEYGTTGNPERNPLKYENQTGKPYPTNKWFTDFTFAAKFRGFKDGQPIVNQFRDEQSPLSLRILDNMRLNPAKEIVEWPGLYITAPKKPYLKINGQNPFYGPGDPFYPYSLQFLVRGDDGVDASLLSMASQYCDDPQTQSQPNEVCVRRTITGYAQLYLSTKWTQYESKGGKPQGSMEALIVRGSPYVTMKYTNLPILFGGSQFLLFAACEHGVCAAEPQHADWEDDPNLNKLNTVSGQVFKIVVGSESDRNKADHLSCGSGNCPIPYLYSIYMLYTSSPVTLAWENNKGNAQINDSYLKIGHNFPVLRTVSSGNCSYGGRPVDLKKCPTIPFTGTVRVAYAGSFPGPATPPVGPDNYVKQAYPAYLDETIQANANLLTQHANVYPYSGNVSLTPEGFSKAKVEFNWHTAEMVKGGFDVARDHTHLLMTAFDATQLSILKNVKIEKGYQVDTLKGKMTGVVSPLDSQQTAKWTQEITISPVLARGNDKIWYGQHPIDLATYKDKIDENLAEDSKLIGSENSKGIQYLDPSPVKNDSYAFGKRAARLARLALIANEMSSLSKNADEKAKYDSYRKLFVTRLREVMSPWFIGQFDHEDPNGIIQTYFKYDNKFGGIVTSNALVKPKSPYCLDAANNNRCGYDQNFYNGQYTDHHFHYGYFIYAAAVLAHFDNQWKSLYQDRVNLLVRDISNTNFEDKYFPLYRHFDWFEGHGMANGLGPNGTGRNQESTSEAVNAWYAMALWGAATNNKIYRDIGSILTTLEIKADQAWWQIMPNTSIYKDISVDPGSMFNLDGKGTERISLSNAGSIGILWESQADGATFFGIEPWYRLGIQMLPYTPITENLFNADWVIQNNKIMAAMKSAMLGRITQILENKSDPLKKALDTYASIRSLMKIQRSDKDYWQDFQAYLNAPFTWSYLVFPIQALGYPTLGDKDLKAFIDAANEANNALKTYPFKSGDKFECAPPGVPVNQQPAKCIVYNYTDAGGPKTVYIPVGIPLMLTGYDGIDQGVSKSNLDWWYATRGGK